MAKYRIYELAKTYETTSKVIMDILTRNQISAKNHMSSVDDEAKAVLDRTFARKTGNEAISEKAKPVKKEPLQQEIISRPEVPSKAPGQTAKREEKPTVIKSTTVAPGAASKPAASSGYTQQRPTGMPRNEGRPTTTNRPGQNEVRPSVGARRPEQQQRQQQPRGQQARGYQRPDQRNQRPASSERPQQTTDRARQQSGQRPMGQKPAFQSNQGTGNAGQNRPRPQNQNSRPSTVTANQQRKPGFNSGQRGNQQNRPGKSNVNYMQNMSRPDRSKKRGAHNYSSQATVAAKPLPTVIQLGGGIIVKDLAEKLGRDVSEIIKKLMMLGVMATINQEVDQDTATLLAEDFGVTVEELEPEQDPTEIQDMEDDPATLLPRPPVVTIMGHVDHGKTSLLDVIRQTNVISTEAGGITQHIGAYQVNCRGKKIVFLDTPGHEAFTAMRARGAQVTDIAVLVVAADDGVKPQTIEAINHAKDAKVPIIIAINKMDKPGANPDHVKQQLSEHGLIPEDWGGDTIMVPVSAHQKEGINDILEMILLVAEMQELKANPNRAAWGTIVEAQLDKGRGPVATVLVQKGTLRIGDTIIAGTAYGKVRAMVNDRGDKVKKADPSTPVEVLGLSDVPQAGDTLVAVEEHAARAIAEKRVAKRRTDELQQKQKVSLEDIFQQIQEGTLKDLNIVIKADVQGSIEALRQALLGLKNKEVRVNIVHSGVGAINESDVMLASAANALIIGFNVRPDTNARKAADVEKIDMRTYRIIYDAINDVEAAITGMLAPEFKEVVQGRVEIRKVITISKLVVAGCYVLEGKVTNSSQVRVLRDGIIIHEGLIDGLRRFKDDVKEVATGYECGITFEKFRDIKEGDVIEAFVMEEVAKAQ